MRRYYCCRFLFAPHLSEMLAVTKEIARLLDPSLDPYAALLREFDPFADVEVYAEHLRVIRERLTEILPRALEKQGAVRADFLSRDVPVDQQRAFLGSLIKDMGYPLERGRLDVSPHPMSFFTSDSRITTRFTDGWEFALTSTIHEMGHALYELGVVSEESFGEPVAQYRSFSVHESQSRLWERYVAATPEFWEWAFPRMQQAYAPALDDVSAADVCAALNHVEPSMIRVSADELTYPLHIILRFELERALFTDELSVEDLPRAWNDKMEEFLGVRPEDDAQGVLQDVHWAQGAFGYFSTYLIGTAMAAQLMAAARNEIPDLVEGFSEGRFAPLLEWLREKVHRPGSLYVTQELFERATGKPFGVGDYLDYLEDKYC